MMVINYFTSSQVSSLICNCYGNYNFTIHFYEFNNPLGLQCAECGSGGPPACCDDVQRYENCSLSKPFTCDTRFRFMLRPFGEPVETALNTGYPYFTPSSGSNSEIFNEGPRGLLALPNPFTITSNEAWSVSSSVYYIICVFHSSDSSHRPRYSFSLML